MKVKKGDVIGTTDGRYGVVTRFVVGNQIEVTEALNPEEECGMTPGTFIIHESEVASIR